MTIKQRVDRLVNAELRRSDKIADEIAETLGPKKPKRREGWVFRNHDWSNAGIRNRRLT